MKKAFRILCASVLMLLSVLCFVCNALGSNTEPSDFNEKKIGVLSGSIFDKIAEDYIKSPKIQYFNSNTDTAVALDKGKIDAYITDQPVWRLMHSEYPDQKCAYVFTKEDYGFIFQKNNEKSAALCDQLNEFLGQCKNDGTLDKIRDLWFGSDESAKKVDFSQLSGKNGTLIFTCTTEIGAPFAYIKDEQFAGYDIDIAVRFCRAYGYGIKIVNTTFAGMLAEVSSGKSDFGASCITITEERKESMLFSDADYVGGSVLVVKTDETVSLDSLAGTKVGVQTGTVFDQVAREVVPQCEINYFNSVADTAMALESGKISSYIVDEPYARMLINKYKNHRILTTLREEQYALALPKVNPRSEKLCTQINEFLKKCRNDGTLDELMSIWVENDASDRHIDLSVLTGENGTLTMAVCSSSCAPFVSVRNNEYIGYDIDFAKRFCEAYGYGLAIVDYDAGGLFGCIAAGKCDFAATCITVTEERKETMLFSDTYYSGGSVLVVKSKETSAGNKTNGLFASIVESFHKTFIREDRYKMFSSGIFTTLIIVVLSVIFGTLFGFLLYLGYYLRGNTFRKITDIFCIITENTPIVMILMILYYVIFGSVEISGMWVSIIGFTLIFAASVVSVIKVGIGAVDTGQREAALALGYTEVKALFVVILPQAAHHFLPGYKSAVVQLIKGTAIVGYIAVQDLTKVSDIIRSRTYEAFFPLIASAVLYFGIAMLVTAAIKHIEFKIDPHLRKKEKILKGVDTE